MLNSQPHKTLFIFLFLSITSCTTEANVIYVSSSGNDRSIGSVDSPLKTISTASLRADTIYLNAGDIFYESISLKDQVITRYGEGKNPVICGFKRPFKPNWIEVSPNVWKTNLTKGVYSGFIVDGSSKLNNIGCLYEYDKNLIHARKMRSVEGLCQDWDIYQTDNDKSDRADNSRFDELYLYYRGNLNNLKLEFSIGDCGVRLADSDLSMVDVVGFGTCGISVSGSSNISFSNIDCIGGSIQISYPTHTCLGNGIEFWISRYAYNCTIEGCNISRCFDCGCTIQASNSGKATPRNIVFRNNFISKCCQGWEDFLRNDSDVVFENCRFEDNIVTYSGESGFGYSDGRFKYCHLLGNNVKGDRGMIIRNNLFIGGNYYCSGSFEGLYKSNNWQNNTCYISRGSYILSNYTGSKDVIRIPKQKDEYSSLEVATDVAIKHYRELTGDKTTKFEIVSDRVIKKMANREELNFIENKRSL